MTDPRLGKLAKLLVGYSTKLKKGETVLLDLVDTPDDFAVALLREVRRVGAVPLVEVRHSRVTREVIKDTDTKHATLVQEIEMFRMKKAQAYIAIRGAANASELADVPADRLALYSKIARPVMNYR